MPRGRQLLGPGSSSHQPPNAKGQWVRLWLLAPAHPVGQSGWAWGLQTSRNSPWPVKEEEPPSEDIEDTLAITAATPARLSSFFSTMLKSS